MPCGGIGFGGPLYPDVWEGDCFHCGKPGANHFCDEWDCFLHAECVLPFLATEEGQIVIEHKHRIVIILDPDEQNGLIEAAQKQKRRAARKRRVA